MTLLSVRDLRVGFGRDPRTNEVVKGVSFDLEAGKTLAIVGESGSGKSVTALSINRLVDFGGGRITGGSIVLDGTRDLTTAEEATLTQVESSGGSVILPKMELPSGYGFIGQFKDPHGHTWGLWSKS